MEMECLDALTCIKWVSFSRQGEESLWHQKCIQRENFWSTNGSISFPKTIPIARRVRHCWQNDVSVTSGMMKNRLPRRIANRKATRRNGSESNIQLLNKFTVLNTVPWSRKRNDSQMLADEWHIKYSQRHFNRTETESKDIERKERHIG